MSKPRTAMKRNQAAPQRATKGNDSKKQKAAPPAAKPALKRAYVSDGDDSDDDDGPASGPIPLASLEQGSVRDFIAEFEREHDATSVGSNGKKKKTQHVSKRARAELEQLAIDKAKKKQREDRAEKVVWRKFDRENRVFEQYYRRALQLSDDEWAQFVAALKTPMAVHARVNSHYKSLAEIVQGTLELDFPVQDVTVRLPSGEDTAVEFAAAPWSDDKLTWRLNLDIKSFRKTEQLRELHTYIQTQSHLGTILRLDPLTMLVARFLGAQQGDRVLDLCGGGEQRAPLIAEMLQRDSSQDTPSASSVLIVNERDAAMAARAVQSLSRTLALSREIVVTAHKPIDFPLASEDDGALFDRVLCSAPCSGDGLVRKIPEKWRTWSPEQGLKLHGTQVALAAKAMSLVRVGGALLYTTRSLNPIENEAVVADLLRSGDGAFELVDLADVCPALKRKPGVVSWDVVDADMNTVSMWETATPAQRKMLRASMWPPTEDEQESTMHLERCVRLLPHDNDTNGLFVALIRKVHAPRVAAAGPELPLSNGRAPVSKEEKKRLKAQKKILGSFVKIDDKALRRLLSFYGISAHNLSRDHVLERSGFAKDSAVHAVSSAVSKLIADVYQGRLVVHRAGVDAFKRIAATGAFELTDDGARALLPLLRRRVLQLPMDEFTTLLAKKEMWLKQAGEAAREVLDETSEGSLVVALDDMEPMQTPEQDLLLVAMKRHNSYSLVSTPAAIARVKTLMKELDAPEEDDEDGEQGFDSDYDELDLDDDDDDDE
ncbi:hypothetical protein P43SY_009129 [Pythium insidiosum]|uniref:SAM-dependent MTase RsmB/NOP-type domain-containing protein n=1 Tax=Pythium insidiosum TaxID=114742 RepID=A0AAD5Q5P8_PYTIN|nr:hypothetical protein P43SY_009129 [Pythium insidiosum]